MQRTTPALALAFLAGCATTGSTPPGPAGPEAPVEQQAEDTSATLAGLPETPRREVTDTYHGVEVTDPYRWLEDGDDPEVQRWMATQNEVARAYLEGLPGEDALEDRFRAILTDATVAWGSPKPAGGRLFALKTEPPKQQPFLVVLPGPDAAGAARVVVDPNALDAEGTTAIDWYEPSPDGTLVAVSLSKAGTESGDLHFFRVEDGAEVFEVVPRAEGGTAGGDVAWSPDGRGVFYTRYPAPGERPEEDLHFYQQLWFHALGTPVSEDRYELGRDFPRIAEIRVSMDPDSGRLLAILQEGDSGRFQHYLRGPAGTWTQLTRYEDKVSAMEFGPQDGLYLLSKKDAPLGRILRLAPGVTDLSKATVVIPEGDTAIDWSFYSATSILPLEDRLFLVHQTGGPSELRTYALPSGEPVEGPELPPVANVAAPKRLPDGSVLFWMGTYTEPSAWYRFDPATGTTERTSMESTSTVSFDDVEVRRGFAVSKDGTRVPYNVMMKKGTPLDGTAPLLATAYGGYGISLSPHFDPTSRVWLDQGGIEVIANVRGGGEFGEAWHREGSGLQKQNTFDDFAAVLRTLVEEGYTRPDRLGILGGSNGGILMGAIITQHPELVEAVVSLVGVYDMLRNEQTPNGQFNVPEYGSVTDAEQFRALYAYSPYHAVEEGTPYPAVLFTAGANDPRVDPMNSRKFTAALQHATASEEPVLLRVDYAAGHGLDTRLDDRVALLAHVYAFLMDQLGMPVSEQRP